MRKRHRILSWDKLKRKVSLDTTPTSPLRPLTQHSYFTRSRAKIDVKPVKKSPNRNRVKPMKPPIIKAKHKSKKKSDEKSRKSPRSPNKLPDTSLVCIPMHVLVPQVTGDDVKVKKSRKKIKNWTKIECKMLYLIVQARFPTTDDEWQIVADKLPNEPTADQCREQYEKLRLQQDQIVRRDQLLVPLPPTARRRDKPVVAVPKPSDNESGDDLFDDPAFAQPTMAKNKAISLARLANDSSFIATLLTPPNEKRHRQRHRAVVQPRVEIVSTPPTPRDDDSPASTNADPIKVQKYAQQLWRDINKKAAKPPKYPTNLPSTSRAPAVDLRAQLHAADETLRRERIKENTYETDEEYDEDDAVL